MSFWTYIIGTIKVAPLGRTQLEKEYILKTVLEHLPIIEGSENPMHIHINQCEGFDISLSHNEFGNDCSFQKSRYTNNHRWGVKGRMEIQSCYILTIEGSFRDRIFMEIYKQFNKWLCRLAKRICVDEILVKITDEYNIKLFNYNYNNPYSEMFEALSWISESDIEPTWCEYLMWERGYNSDFPMSLLYKYHKDDKNDLEMKRRNRWRENNDE